MCDVQHMPNKNDRYPSSAAYLGDLELIPAKSRNEIILMKNCPQIQEKSEFMDT